MEDIKIDNRTKQDIIREIKELAKSYTPEWRYNDENKDVGVCLAEVYTDMIYRNLQLYNAFIRKSKISLLNLLNANILPAKASTGYVSFHLVNSEVPGCYVEAGTRMYAETQEENNKNVFFETMEDLYVTSAKPDYIYTVSDKADYISINHTLEDKNPFALFAYDKENMQKHEMYLCHDQVFQISNGGRIEINFHNSSQNNQEHGSKLHTNYLSNIPKESIDNHFYNKIISIGTYTENGFIELNKGISESGDLYLDLPGDEEIVKTSVEGIKSTWIRFSVKDIQFFSGFSYDNIRIKSKGSNLKPKVIYGGGIECNQTEYMPFGERMGCYQEVLFASDEVLSKKGAKIVLRFKIAFEKTPLSTNVEREIEWNWIMKAKEFSEEKIYEINIGKVVWEYYNGNGFVRLFKDDSYSDVFSYNTNNDTNMSQLIEWNNKYKEISFICPKDISYYEAESVGSYYIRARILTMNNEYKLNGYYLTPVLSETYFDYEYMNDMKPQYIYTENNTESRLLSGKDINEKNRLTPFFQTGTKQNVVYLGFKEAPAGEIIKILFLMSEISDLKTSSIKWEYYGKNQWKELNIIDETENFRKSGIVTIAGDVKFIKKIIFNKDLYWIRLIDTEDFYNMQSRNKRPYIKEIHMNSVKACAVKSNEEDHFIMEEYEAGKKINLKKGDILTSHVYIDEGTEDISLREWERVEDFLYSSSEDRHYILDPINGIIQFGNGIQGMIPPASKEYNIHVIYKTGGGEYTNVKKHEITKMEKSIGYINKVHNYVGFSGGTDKESVDDAIYRNTSYLRHRGQALTIRDFEKLSKEASPYILRTSCIAGIDKDGKQKKGSVTLIIVSKDLKKGILHFDEIKEEILSHLKPRMASVLINFDLFQIRRAEFVEASVKVSIAVNHHKNIYKVRQQINNMLCSFFNPENGLQIGEMPKAMRIKNLISGIKDVVMINHLSLCYYLENEYGKYEKEADEIKKNPFIFIINGEHDIHISSHMPP